MRTISLIAAALTAAASTCPLVVHADSAASPQGGSAQGVEPGKVGPGSENNSQVAPTSPSIPVNKQPPPEIAPANSGSGSSAGEKGSGPDATTPPYNPTSPTR